MMNAECRMKEIHFASLRVVASSRLHSAFCESHAFDRQSRAEGDGVAVAVARGVQDFFEHEQDGGRGHVAKALEDVAAVAEFFAWQVPGALDGVEDASTAGVDGPDLVGVGVVRFIKEFGGEGAQHVLLQQLRQAWIEIHFKALVGDVPGDRPLGLVERARAEVFNVQAVWLGGDDGGGGAVGELGGGQGLVEIPGLLQVE